MGKAALLTGNKQKNEAETVTLTVEELRQLLAAEVAKAAAAAKAAKISLKVSEKGAVSITGLRRFPITLYASELEAILNMADIIRQFIKDNKAKLSYKSAE